QAEPLDQGDVLAEAGGVVARHVARVAALHAARLLAEHVPDRETLAVGARRALDLVRGRRRAPLEPIGELEERHARILTGPYPPARMEDVRALYAERLAARRAAAEPAGSPAPWISNARQAR